ncbi:MAG: hypothetical protein LBS59_06595 [Puniceicoccales bacterium]|jgi:hypothetical protein|nr:hypothetical protein [Puniceicoccales bacterium]
MQTTRPFSTQSKIPFAAALLTAFCLLFFHGCKKTSAVPARIEAAALLGDQTALADVAKKDNDRDVRKAAAGKLTDQTALASIARTDADSTVTYAALERIKDSGALDSIARHEGAAPDIRLGWVNAKMLAKPDRPSRRCRSGYPPAGCVAARRQTAALRARPKRT